MLVGLLLVCPPLSNTGEENVTDVLYFGNSAALELVSVALVGPGQRLISYPLPAAAAAEPP